MLVRELIPGRTLVLRR